MNADPLASLAIHRELALREGRARGLLSAMLNPLMAVLPVRHADTLFDLVNYGCSNAKEPFYVIEEQPDARAILDERSCVEEKARLEIGASPVGGLSRYSVAPAGRIKPATPQQRETLLRYLAEVIETLEAVHNALPRLHRHPKHRGWAERRLRRDLGRLARVRAAVGALEGSRS